MRRIKVAPLQRVAGDDGHFEDLLVYAVMIGGVAFAALVLGAQLQAALSAIM